MPIFNAADLIANNGVVRNMFRFKEVKIDTITFRLYYKLSLGIMLFYSFFHVYAVMNGSTLISCIGSGPHDDEFMKRINHYCWIYGTFSVRRGSRAGIEGQISPGVGNMGFMEESDTIFHHYYYKWIYIAILFAVVAHYAPHFVWRRIENGTMKRVTDKMHCIYYRIDSDQDDVAKQLNGLAHYIHRNLGLQKGYARGFIIAEILNVVVCFLLLFMWDHISGHELFAHASSLAFLHTAPGDRDDRLMEIFPVIGKCTYKMYGPGGGVQIRDFICVLPINLINERAVVFFWHYYIALIIIGFFQLAFRALLVLSKDLRKTVLRRHLPIFPEEDINLIADHLAYSDWFFTILFGNNVPPIVFRLVMQKLANHLKTDHELQVLEIEG